MKSVSTYGRLCAEFYDLSKPVGAETRDVSYYMNYLSDRRGAILDAGCGTGRLLIPAVMAGLDIIGVDASRQMLRICRTYFAAKKLDAELLVADLRQLRVGRSFATILCPFGTLALFDDDDLARVLQGLQRHLQPGGRFLADVPIIDVPRGRKRYERVVRRSSGGAIRLTIESCGVPVPSVLEQSLHYVEYDPNGVSQAEERQELPLFSRQPAELLDKLRRSGFDDVTVHADYDRNRSAGTAAEAICVEARIAA